MWILFRLLIIAGAAAFRIFKLKRVSGEPAIGPGGFPYFILNSKRKKNGVFFEVDSPCSFHLIPEKPILEFFKRIGFGSELQTGDPEFDAKFYIASDDRYFLQALKQNLDLRNQFLRLADLGHTHIRFDDKQLKLKYDFGSTFNPELEAACRKLKTNLESLTRGPVPKDRFLWRIIALEVILWAGMGYAVGSYFELSFDYLNYLIEPWPLVLAGIKISLLVFALWFAILFIAVRKSSRAPLLISESLAGLVIGLLFIGPQAAVDYNRYADTSEAELVEANVVDKFSKVVRSGRNRRTNFYLVLDAEAKYKIGPRFQVLSSDYYEFTPPQRARIIVRGGRLNAHYIESIEAGESISQQSLINSAFSKLNLAQARTALTWKPNAESEITPDNFREDRWPNGLLRTREPLVNGRNHGVASYWHANGKLYAEIPWVNGQKNGIYKLFREDGTLESEISMRAGQTHGWTRWYDAQGKLKQEEVYADGKHVPLSFEERHQLK